MRLDLEAARDAIHHNLAEPLRRSVEEAAHGMLRLVSATMMRAIRAVSVERGRDPRQFAMLAFGGNGPLFATGIAAELGISRIIIPPLPGVFSAFGLLVADAEHHGRQSIRVRLDVADPARVNEIVTALTEAGAHRLRHDGFNAERQTFHRAASARYAGQSSEIEVALPDGDISPALIGALFAEEHERTHGFRAPDGEPVELIGLSVMARGLPEQPRLPGRIPPSVQAVPASRLAWFPGEGWVETPVTDRAGLTETVAGPLIVQEYDATCLVPKGMNAWVDDFGNIRLDRELMPSFR
jgi:N-methylhydantoinase A